MNNINKNIENLKIIENENNNSEIINIFNNDIFNNNNYNNNFNNNNNIVINNNNSTTLNKIISLMFENIKNKVNSNLFKQLKILYKKDLEKFK